MNQSTYRMRRRVGGALLAGVTALGVAGVAALGGGGVADAAVTSVTASLTTAAGTIPGTSGTPTKANAADMQVALNASPSVGDQVVLTAACPSTGSVSWYGIQATGATAESPLPATSAATGIAITDTAGNTWWAYYSNNGDNCGNNELVLVEHAANSSPSTTTPAIPLTGIEFQTTGVTTQSINVSGQYLTLGAAPVTFSVPSPASVNWFTVTANVPPVQLSGTGNQSVSNVTVEQPANLSGAFNNTTSYNQWSLSVQLSNGSFASAPTLSVVPPSSATLSSTAASLSTTAVTNDTATATFTSINPTLATNYVFSNMSIAPTGNGAVTAEITLNNINTTTKSSSSVEVASGVQVASVTGSSTRIYGQTPDETVAQEFEAAFPVTGNTHPTSAVLATNVDPYDALSASYLESQLGTGLLITPPTSLGASAAAALRLEGISTVYVVGGPDAISPAVITQLENTPVYNVGGVTTTGAMIKVVGPIYGQTAADTAKAIATYFGGAFGSLPPISGAYNATGGAFNDTSGTASTTGPTASSQTAFVISDTDWQDATTLGPIAYTYRIPVVLTSPTSLSTQASQALTTLGVKQVIIVGGQLALSNTVVPQIQALNGGVSVLRIAGQDYTDTATELAKFEAGSSGTGLNWTIKAYLVSHGDYWSDALGAAALSATNFGGNGNEPILTTVNPTTIGTYLQTYLNSVASTSATIDVNVLGGPLAVTPTVVSSIQSSLAA